MALMPGARFRPAEFNHVPMDRYDIVCVHTIVGFAPAPAAHFSTTADGDIIQSRDTRWRSGANLNGNHRVIAIENEDHGPRFGGTPRLPQWVPLTDEQVAANAEILRWAHETHGVPLQLCPDSRPRSRGLAYHRQGIDGNFDSFRFPGRVEGGEVWTLTFGKVCPTDARIAQLPDILRIARGEDEDVTPEELRIELERFGKNAGELIKVDQDGKPDSAKVSLERALRIQTDRVRALEQAIPELVDKAVKDALANSVINVNVNVGTKES